MNDATRVAEGLSEDEARQLQREHAAALQQMGEAADGRCAGIRDMGDGSWAVYIGYQDGGPVTETPQMRK